MAFDQIKYNNEFNKEKYDQIIIRAKKGKKQELKEFAATQDLSVSEVGLCSTRLKLLVLQKKEYPIDGGR